MTRARVPLLPYILRQRQTSFKHPILFSPKSMQQILKDRMRFQQLQTTTVIYRARKYVTADYLSVLSFPWKAPVAVNEKTGPALRITSLEFKLKTAQYLFFHCKQRKMCSSVRQGIISALMGRGEDKGDKTFFFCENAVSRILSFKRGHCSLLLGRGRRPSTITLDFCRKWGSQNALLVQTWRNITAPPVFPFLPHEGIWLSHLSWPSSGTTPMLFPNHAMHWD